MRMPPARPAPAQCPTLGYHSRAAGSPNASRWVQVDLGRSEPITAVVVVPAVGPPGDDGPGYFFPPCFHIDFAQQPDLSDATRIAEIDSSTVTPGRPVVVLAGRHEARYVRITASRLAGRDGRYFFALGEVLVLAGNLNLAANRPVAAFDSIENAPVWGTRYLVDGQGMIGPPLSSSRSSSNGYHAAVSATPDTVKWAQVALEKPMPLDEVRLVPARPSDFADRSGFGFPVRFKVEASCDPDFRETTTLLDATGTDYPNPGDGIVVISAAGVTARYIRVTATKLWERTGDYVFALAELQVYALGRNQSAGKPVTALDSIERGLWSRKHLVDGHASQCGLWEWPLWAENELRWADWDTESRHLEAEWEPARAQAFAMLGRLAIAYLVLVVVLAGGLVWRYRRLRRREAERLREQIARDLHDEVGSNLGSILLLAQAGDGQDLPQIGRIARQTAEAMRDLVWLLENGPETTVDIITKLRECAAVLLMGTESSFIVAEGSAPEHVTPQFKRHLFLAFKEVLHNVVRHSGARKVAIRCYRDGPWLIIEVQDDGKGFDLTEATAGTGLRGLQQRARHLGGEAVIQTAPGMGTMVRLIVPVV